MVNITLIGPLPYACVSRHSSELPLANLIMSSAFSKTLRHAKITNHDPRIVQVITSPKPYLSRGDIGVKSNVDVMINNAKQGQVGDVRYVQVKNIDNPNGIGLEWKEREQQVMLLEQWRELNVPVDTAEESSGSLRRNESLDPQTKQYQESRRGSSQLRSTSVPVMSRFDRSSVRRFGKQRTSHVRAGPSSEPMATAESSVTSDSAVVPNYSIMSNKEFQTLLDFVRANRSTFLEQKILHLATARRATKFRQAGRAYTEAQDKREYDLSRGASAEAETEIVKKPTWEDFPLESEIETARGAIQAADSAGELDPLVNPLDLFNLARSTKNSEMAAFLKKIYAKVKVDDPTSQMMPRSSSETAQSMSTSASRLHALGGLQYSQPDSVFMEHLSSAVPGHVVGQDQGTGRGDRYSAIRRPYLVSVASRLMNLPRNFAYGATEVDWRRENDSAGSPLVKFVGPATLRNNLDNLAVLPNRLRFSASNASWDSDLRKLNLGYIDARVRNVDRIVKSEQEDISQYPFKNILGSKDWHKGSQEPVQIKRSVLGNHQLGGYSRNNRNGRLDSSRHSYGESRNDQSLFSDSGSKTGEGEEWGSRLNMGRRRAYSNGFGYALKTDQDTGSQ
ncbi:unnamed protein product [Sympodiomycopsis kandeliae]